MMITRLESIDFPAIVSLTKRSALLAILALLSACSDTGKTTMSFVAPDTQAWEISAPQILLDRAINPDELVPRVVVNGQTVNVIQSGGTTTYRGNVRVPEGEDVTLSVQWIEFVNSRSLLLAVLERTFEAVDSDTNVVLLEDEYEVEDFVAFPRLDDDNDRVPNLAERQENSDPFSATDPGDNRADAFIIAISPDDAPIINGSFDAVWGDAQFRDREAELLSIDNRMTGFDPARADQATEYRWGAMHDGRFLYLFILGEAAANRTTHGDSALPWMDDAVDIFWDGNRSQGTSYDGVDDYHLIIPLVKLDSNEPNRSNLPNGTLDPTGRGETGTNSVQITDFEGVRFATCVCPNADTYEIRLDMEALGIPLDRSFGFEIQLNDDADGGERDFKFGWRAPSAGAGVSSFDETWNNPSLMGLVELISAADTPAAFVE